MLRLLGLVSPPPGSSIIVRARGFILLFAIVVVLLAIGFGLAELVTLPFGGVGTFVAVLIGIFIVVAVLGVLTLVGRRRQSKALEARRAGSG